MLSIIRFLFVSKAMRSTLLALFIAAGGWTLYNREQIHEPTDIWKLLSKQVSEQFVVEPNDATAPTLSENASIRIASFNIQTFGQKKAGQQDVMEILKDIVTQFDVVAIQEIRSKDQSLLKKFVADINADGHQYASTIGDRVGRSSHQEQYAFIFDQRTIALDRVHSYTVSDPQDLFHREPLVGWFRTQSNSGNAFTFSLLNLHLDQGRPDQEIVFLDDLFRAVRRDGRGEDDIIVAGDFNANSKKMRFLRKHGLRCILTDEKTNTRGTKQYDNLLINSLATSEFTGASGVYDFLKVHNLSLQQALRVSDHMPVWAEFSIEEDAIRLTEEKASTLR